MIVGKKKCPEESIQALGASITLTHVPEREHAAFPFPIGQNRYTITPSCGVLCLEMDKWAIPCVADNDLSPFPRQLDFLTGIIPCPINPFSRPPARQHASLTK